MLIKAVLITTIIAVVCQTDAVFGATSSSQMDEYIGKGSLRASDRFREIRSGDDDPFPEELDYMEEQGRIYCTREFRWDREARTLCLKRWNNLE
jgi:hypothetical protein